MSIQNQTSSGLTPNTSFQRTSGLLRGPAAAELQNRQASEAAIVVLETPSNAQKRLHAALPQFHSSPAGEYP